MDRENETFSTAAQVLIVSGQYTLPFDFFGLPAEGGRSNSREGLFRVEREK
jgi:hypothetical protein